MDVRKTFLAVAFSCVISACSNSTKMTSATESLTSAQCAGASAVKSRAIVQWENGAITYEKVDAVDDFKNDFVKPNIDQIKRVQFDQKIQFHPQQLASQISAQSVSPDWGQTIIQLDSVDIKDSAGNGVLVGVVDAFVDFTHPQLKGQIAVNNSEIPNNGIDDDKNGIIDDYYGASFLSKAEDPKLEVSAHGTHVSGIIAADPSLGPVRGIARKAKIIPAQFISNDGSGYLSDAIKALEYVSARGAKVINASWGGSPCSAEALLGEFKSLEQRGIIIVVAAGNESTDLDTHPNYPAAFNLSNQITVAASTEVDFMAYFSNSSFSLVHIAAPGTNIFSTVPSSTTDPYMDGTSMATPFVTGAAALLLGARPTATPQQIKTALMNSVDIKPTHEFRVQSQGRLNIYKAYLQIKAMIP